MKKNVMMRLASFLLIAVLISTSAISGTYAKYVTSDTGSDVARVAKFGVTVEIAADSNFSNQYATHDTNYSGAISVASSDAANVVAPGTSSEDVGGEVTFKITGTPEVATKIDIVMTKENDIYLGAGTYGDPTTAVTTDKFTIDDPGYYPVVFTLKKSGGTVVATGNLEAIATAFNALTAYKAPNTPLDETYTLTWAWDFNGNDAADTMLGNLAAGEGWNIGDVDDYNVDLDYEITISVTQVD